MTAPKIHILQVVLWLLPFVPLTTLAYHYDGLRMYVIAGAIQAMLIGVAAWFIGLRRATNGKPHQGVTAAGAALLVASGAVVSLGWNMGTPPAGSQFLATQIDQQFRYTTLLVGAILALGGLTILRYSLQQAGEAVWSWLGYTAILLATALFVINNAALQIGFEAVRQSTSTGRQPSWVEPFRNYFVYLTIFWAVLVYTATWCYAASLRQVGWMGNLGAGIFIALSVAGVVLVPFFPLTGSASISPAERSKCERFRKDHAWARLACIRGCSPENSAQLLKSSD